MLPPLRLASCLSLVLAFAALVPEARGDEKPAGSPAPAPAEGAAAAVDPKAIEALRRAFDAQQAKGTHRVKVLAAQGREALAPAAEVDFVFPDRIRLRSQGMEMVSIGNSAWVKIGEKWQPAPEARAVARNFSDPARREEMIRNCISARALGPSTLHGEAVEGYEFRHRTKKTTSRSVFYVTPADGLPRKIEIEAETKGTPVRSVMEYSDYGAAIAIEAPKEG